MFLPNSIMNPDEAKPETAAAPAVTDGKPAEKKQMLISS